MSKILKTIAKVTMIFVIAVSLMQIVAFAEDNSMAYDNLTIDVEAGDKITFDTWASFEAIDGRLKLEAPDKSIVYLGEFNGIYGDYHKSVKLLNPQEGMYIATVKIQDEDFRKYGICFKEISPSPTGLTNVIIFTDDIPDGFDKTIRLRYDNSKLELTDGCALTHTKELSQCTIEELGIEMHSAGKGIVSFDVMRDSQKNLSEILNVIQFRQLNEQPSYAMIVIDLE